MAVERDTAYSFEDIYADYPNGVGERPATTLVSRTIKVAHLKTEKAFRNVMRRRSVRTIVEEYQNEDLHVGAKWNIGEVTLFVSQHRNAIAAISVGIAGATAGIYMARRSR